MVTCLRSFEYAAAVENRRNFDRLPHLRRTAAIFSSSICMEAKSRGEKSRCGYSMSLKPVSSSLVYVIGLTNEQITVDIVSSCKLLDGKVFGAVGFDDVTFPPGLSSSAIFSAQSRPSNDPAAMAAKAAKRGFIPAVLSFCGSRFISFGQ